MLLLYRAKSPSPPKAVPLLQPALLSQWVMIQIQLKYLYFYTQRLLKSIQSVINGNCLCWTPGLFQSVSVKWGGGPWFRMCSGEGVWGQVQDMKWGGGLGSGLPLYGRCERLEVWKTADRLTSLMNMLPLVQRSFRSTSCKCDTFLWNQSLKILLDRLQFLRQMLKLQLSVP